MFSGTFFLYLFIILVTTQLAALSQRYMHDGRVIFNIKYLVIAFFVHWFFIAFTNIGVDHDQYLRIIEYDSYRRFANFEEVGFNGLCIILQRLTGNAEVVVFIIKTMIMLLFYWGLYLMKDKANLCFAVLAFNGWQYFSNFYILAHSLAVSLVFLASVFILCKEKWYWPLIICTIATSIHVSALITLLLMLSVLFLNRFQFRMNYFFVMIVLAIAIFLLYNISNVFKVVVTEIDAFEQYSNYEESQNAGGGLFNFVLFAYIFLFIVFPALSSKMSDVEQIALIMFAVFGFFSSIMGYYLGSARLNHYTLILYSAAIPWYFHQRRIKPDKGIIQLDVQRLTWLSYLLFLAYITLNKFTDPSYSSMLAEYSLFNPFTWK